MPLQWLPLQQRQAQEGWGSSRQTSPYSQALTPQKAGGISGGAMPQTKGFMEKMDEQQALEAERKYQEKMMKLQHEQAMEKMKFAARLEEDVRKREVSSKPTVSTAQAAQIQQIESNPEPAAKEMYELLKTLPDESKQQLLQQIFTPTSTGGTISSGGKTIKTAGKYNPIANVFLEKGWAMMDASGRPTLSEPVREFEKGTWSYNDKDNLMVNTATGETVKMSVEGVDGELIADAYNYGMTYMGKLTDPTLLERINPDNMALYMENAKKESQLATMNYLLGQGVSKKEAKDIAYSVPIGERKTTKTTTPKPEPTTGKNAPLDEEKAKGLAEYLKNNPDADIEAYRDRDGDATVDRALEINKTPTTTTTKTTKATKKEEENKTKEPTLKKYFDIKKYPSL